MTGTGLVVMETTAGGTLAPMAPADLLTVWLAGKSPRTVAAYRADLEAFAAWAGAPTMPAALEAFLALPHGDANANALRYRGAMTDAGLAPATVNRRLAALRSVVQLARMTGRVAWTLECPSVEATKYRDTRGPGLTAFRAMVAVAERGTDAKSRRDLALLRVLFDLGLRREEAVSCDLAHYDRTAGTLAIMGKRRRDRAAVTVPAAARAALEAWIAVRGEAPGPLFVPLSRAGIGERLTGRSVARIVAAVAARAGVGHVRPHGLRHSGITALLDVGSTLQDVQKFSRHRDVRTLMIYDDNRSDVAGKMAAMLSALV
jgi:integrase/recombinase XerC